MSHRVVIYRSRLLALSETFIFNHYSQLGDIPRLLVGERRIPGIDLDGLDVVTNQVGADRFKTALFKLNPAGSSLRPAIESFRPTLIHAHFATDAIDMVPIARTLNVPLVVTLHGFDATTNVAAHIKKGPSRWNYLLRRRQLFKHAHLFLAVSDFIKEEAIRNGFPEQKIVTHYLGTKIPSPPPPDGPREGVLFVGRLVEKKGLKYLLQAARILKDRGLDVPVKVIGSGPLDAEMRQLAISLRINVNFMGARSHSEVLAEMAKAKAFCMPSVRAKSGDSEGLPTVALEAQAAACPVVAFDQGPIPESVRMNQTAVLAKDRDCFDLADQLAHLFSDNALAQSMGRNARAFVEERFDIIKRTENLLSIYQSIRLRA